MCTMEHYTATKNEVDFYIMIWNELHNALLRKNKNKNKQHVQQFAQYVSTLRVYITHMIQTHIHRFTCTGIKYLIQNM